MKEYDSEAIKNYIRWQRKHPIKSIENMLGQKLNLWQKIQILIIEFKQRSKEKRFIKEWKNNA